MSNLKELTLHMTIKDRNEFIDGNHINNEILVHMPQLDRFDFYNNTDVRVNDSIVHLSKDDIQRTFSKMIYKQVECIVNYRYHLGTCHVFSLPFMFDKLRCIGNIFPTIIFNHVRMLSVEDAVPFKHEFFIRLAWSFPLLKQLRVFNLQPQSLLSDQTNNQLYSMITYSHLISLRILDVHIDYIDQFLNDTKACLPFLTELTVDYNQLKIVTENFQRDRTRINCNNVKKLNINQTNIQSKDFDGYFPLL